MPEDPRVVIVRLTCGLGNQMFQYAFGRTLAFLNQTDLKLDLTHYDQFKDRHFELDIFNIDAKPASREEIVSINGCPPGERKKGLFKHFDRFMRWINPSDDRKIVREKHCHFEPQALKISGDIYIMGYWQSHKYFESVADIIRKEFSFKRPPDIRNSQLLEEIAANESVAVHVRRGDYVCHPVFTMNDFHSYYRRCCEELSNRCGNPHFYVFSDDPEWVSKNLKINGGVTFVTHNFGISDHEDLRLMSACKHQVIANSTFSWWGAWLNPNPSKIVFAPQVWSNKTGRNCRDVVPPEWIKI